MLLNGTFFDGQWKIKRLIISLKKDEQCHGHVDYTARDKRLSRLLFLQRCDSSNARCSVSTATAACPQHNWVLARTVHFKLPQRSLKVTMVLLAKSRHHTRPARLPWQPPHPLSPHLPQENPLKNRYQGKMAPIPSHLGTMETALRIPEPEIPSQPRHLCPQPFSKRCSLYTHSTAETARAFTQVQELRGPPELTVLIPPFRLWLQGSS